MRKLIVSEFVTLDGVMEDPSGSEQSKYGGWSFQFFDEEYAKYKSVELFASDALLLGRVTYQVFAAAWPSRTDKEGFADRMNSLPKFVVSTTLESLEWNNSRLIKGNVVEEISKLKRQSGQDILIAGSGELVRTLMQHDLIDEYQLLVYPLVLGRGKRLFKDVAKPVNLKLLETRSFTTGVVLLSYEPERK
jgi:dihydrofolate reductase